MDRQIVYPGSIPLDTDILNAQRDAMVALGYLAQATLGTNVVVDGLACTATSPASLSVTVGPGCITQFGDIDTTNFGSLPALANPLLRLGINIGGTNFALAPPSTPGQSISYLIEASFLEQDATPIVLPYYNAANPAQPFSGPGNDGATQNTQRQQTVQLQLKPGAPAETNAQLPPAVDQGWVGLWLITVANGAAEINQSAIAPYPTAPFVTWKLPNLSPGTHQMQIFGPTTQGNWTVPAGTTVVKLRLWGGGGAGGGGVNNTAGGGGGGGGYVEGYFPVTPGNTIAVAIGNGGAGIGSAGGSSSFGALATASGGLPGGQGVEGGVGGAGGAGGGASSTAAQAVIADGATGGIAYAASSTWISGAGGGCFGNGGALPAVIGGPGVTGILPGVGGSGGIGGSLGGNGGPGYAIVEW